MNNAKIHMYEELQALVHGAGELLFFLPPYSPDLNPIEVGFSLLKRWIQRHANMAFRENPLAVLKVAMYQCTRQKDLVGEGLYRHCGYKQTSCVLIQINQARFSLYTVTPSSSSPLSGSS